MIDIDYLRQTFGLEGRTALVTGAGRGIGFGIADALARAGAHVVLNDVSAEVAGAAADKLRSQGLSAEGLAFNVTDEQVADGAVKSVIAKLGGLDILVSNAGNQDRKPFHEYTRAEWDLLVDVHLNGAFHVVRAAIPSMRAKGFGRIVLMSSITGIASRGTIVPYASVKGALAAMTRALAVEYGKEGITVNALAPGYIQTEFTSTLQADELFQDYIRRDVPLGRIGQVSDLGPAVVYLTSPAAAFISGEVLTIDGGTLAKF